MEERGIIFQGEMVNAILEGRKTQTRRIMRYQPEGAWLIPPVGVIDGRFASNGCASDVKCPYGKPGDILYVRETCRPYAYAARVLLESPISGGKHRCWGGPHFEPYDERWKWFNKYGKQETFHNGEWVKNDNKGWCPSIHMPRWASRIDLEIIDIRVERIQDISMEDCWAEGVMQKGDESTVFNAERGRIADVWDSINGKGGWDLNPWVWVVGFKRIK